MDNTPEKIEPILVPASNSMAAARNAILQEALGRAKDKGLTNAVVKRAPYIRENSVAPTCLEEASPRQLKAIYMRAAGICLSGVAEQLGINKKTLMLWEAEPWFKNTLMDIIRQRGGDLVEEMIRTKGPTAVEKIYDLMNDPEVKPEVQQKSAFFIVDKIVPDKLDVQRMQNLPPSVVNREIQVLDAEIEEITNGRSNRATSPTDETSGEEASTAGVAQTA